MQPITLKIEKSKTKLWGRVLFEDNLIIDVARTQLKLEKRMKKLIHHFHNVDVNEIAFDIRYDVERKRIFQKRQRGNRTLHR